MHKSQIEMILRDLLYKHAVLRPDKPTTAEQFLNGPIAWDIIKLISDKADEILKLAYSSLIGEPGPMIGQRVELSPTGDSIVPVQPEFSDAKILTSDDILHLIATRQTSRIRMNAKLDGEFFKALEIQQLRVVVDIDRIEIKWMSEASREYGEHELVITEDNQPIDFLPGRDVGNAHTYQLYIDKLQFKVE